MSVETGQKAKEMNLDSLFEEGVIDICDRTFARTIRRLGNCRDPWVALAAALVSRAASAGHVCLELADVQRQSLPDIKARAEGVSFPAPEQWRERLLACPAIGVAGDYRPLILDGGRLYLHRLWQYEQELARSISDYSTKPGMRREDDAELNDALLRHFDDLAGEQARAARLAVTKRFCVISGGPGTGKTYTIAKILSLLQSLQPDRPLRICLGAPTGKAAARLQAAIEDLAPTAETAVACQYKARTLHRMLGYMPSAARFRYTAENPLPADVVIVDEASMIDLVMMRQLIQAVPERAGLILVGDKDQLASVEAGAVLGDICHGIRSRPDAGGPSGHRPSPGGAGHANAVSLADHIVVLERSHRYDEHGGIGALGRAINAGDANRVLALLADDENPSIALKPLSDWAAGAEAMEADILKVLGPLCESGDASEAFERLNRFKILCAVRKGPFGVEAMNRWVTHILHRTGCIQPQVGVDPEWYPGRPVMITRNDYFQGLFNGDIGVVMMPQDGDHEARIVFPAPDGGIKSIRPQQLPDHQTVYAMTIHKSQGSEFEHVMVVLPDEDMPLLTRELIYTAVTRARRSMTIWAPPELLARAVERPIRRASGLRQILWGA